MHRVFNFGAGPATLPLPVLQKVQQEFLDYQGMGASIIEISHRCKQFEEVLQRANNTFRELVSLPDNYKIIWSHGGARMQFASVPMNLIGLSPVRKALYTETGSFAKIAQQEAALYGTAKIVMSGKETNYDRIPALELSAVDQDAAYLHITSNNTIFGTRWNQFPETGEVPLVADMTSELLSREIDYKKFGLIYAGLQKNLGVAGLALVIIREDLLGHQLSETPTLLNFKEMVAGDSLVNTTNTFAIYVAGLVFEWLRDLGGIREIEKINERKAKKIYDVLDKSAFYKPFVQKNSRSIMNVTFNLPNAELEGMFVKEALKENLYALKGHRNVGGIRASIYNAMPEEGCEALARFMENFEKKNG